MSQQPYDGTTPYSSGDASRNDASSSDGGATSWEPYQQPAADPYAQSPYAQQPYGQAPYAEPTDPYAASDPYAGARSPYGAQPQDPYAGQSPVSGPIVGMAPDAAETSAASMSHWGAIIAGMFTAGWIAPLIVLLTAGQRSSFVNRHAKQSLNIELTLLIVNAIGWATSWFGIGFVILVLAWMTGIVLHVKGAGAANRGEDYRAPAIQFLR